VFFDQPGQRYKPRGPGTAPREPHDNPVADRLVAAGANRPQRPPHGCRARLRL